MDREHLAAIVGRLRGWCDPARGASNNLRSDLSAAAAAIEALVSGSAKLTPVKWQWVLPDGYSLKENVVAEGDPETGEQHGERLVWSWRGRGETGDADTWREALKEAWMHWAETGGE